MKIITKEDRTAWIPFKFERLPSFCFLYGTMGNMKRECDLADDRVEILNIPDNKLPYGNWIKASPAKKVSVTSENMKEKHETSLMRRRFFEKIRIGIEGKQQDDEAGIINKDTAGIRNTPTEVTEVSEELGKITVCERDQEKWEEV
ncbi:hypothetical protein ACS0TY_034440 [Phlomoides rotata]